MILNTMLKAKNTKMTSANKNAESLIGVCFPIIDTQENFYKNATKEKEGRIGGNNAEQRTVSRKTI